MCLPVECLKPVVQESSVPLELDTALEIIMVYNVGVTEVHPVLFTQL